MLCFLLSMAHKMKLSFSKTKLSQSKNRGWRWTKVDVSKCHACHAKCSYMSPSATPATQKAAACHVKRRWTKVDVSKRHACHAKCSYMSPSATPATQKAAASTATCGNRARHQSQPSAIRATPATWNEGGRRWMSQSATPTTQSYMSPSATPATQKAAASTATCGNRARHQSQPNAIRATPATWNEGGRRWMSQSATPATQSAATCRQVPRLPRKKCASCVWVSCVCVCASCVWVSCVWVSCVCVQVVCE